MSETDTGFRDLNAREDFDEKGEVKSQDLADFYASEREKLLGQPVGGDNASGGYADAPAPVEKAAPDAEAVFNDGDSADYLAARYSKAQLQGLATRLGVEFVAKTTVANLAISIQKAGQEKADSEKETSLTVPPAAPELQGEASDASEGEKDDV